MDLYITFDADQCGRLVGRARLNDDIGEIARLSQAINAGNEIFASYALRYGGSIVEIAGDEGLISVPVEAIKELEAIRHTYESCVKATVSVGVGKLPSEASKALLVAKLQGRNRTVIYDAEVEKVLAEAQGEKSEKAKIIEEYLTKSDGTEAPLEPLKPHRDGFSPHATVERKATLIPQAVKPTLKVTAKAPPTIDFKAFENQFRSHADQNEVQEKAKNMRQSDGFRAVKDQISQSLQTFQQQMPALAQVRQSNPEAYQAMLGIVQGLIGLGRQVQEADQALAKAEKPLKRYWVGSGIKIPAHGTDARRRWNDNFRQVAAEHFAEGKAHLLKPIKVNPKDVVPSHAPKLGNEQREALYERMVRGGDKLPPLIVYKHEGVYHAIDGHTKREVALRNNVTQQDAYELLNKNLGAMADVTQVPIDDPLNTEMVKVDLMAGGVADQLRPEDFDPEALAIGTQHEFEHTNDIDLAREIAMDHLAEDPDYYKDLYVKEEPSIKVPKDIVEVPSN